MLFPRVRNPARVRPGVSLTAARAVRQRARPRASHRDHRMRAHRLLADGGTLQHHIEPDENPMDGFKPRGFGAHIRRGVLPWTAHEGRHGRVSCGMLRKRRSQPFRRAVQRPARSAFRRARHSHRGVGRRRLRICHRQHARILHRRDARRIRGNCRCAERLAHAESRHREHRPWRISPCRVLRRFLDDQHRKRPERQRRRVEQPRFLPDARIAFVLCAACPKDLAARTRRLFRNARRRASQPKGHDGNRRRAHR